MAIKAKVQNRFKVESKAKTSTKPKEKIESKQVQKRTMKMGSKLNQKSTKTKNQETNELTMYDSKQVQSLTADKMQVIEFVEENKSEFERLLTWFRDTQNKEVESEVIEFKIDKHLKGDYTARSVRIYNNILKRIDKFCEANSNLKVMDIINQFLLEGIEKYCK